MKQKDKNRRSQENNRRILQDYQRKGKRFIPPMLQLEGLTETDWMNDRVPELVWIALLLHTYGVKEGIEVAVDIAKVASKCNGDSNKAFAAISEYAELSENNKDCVRFMLRSEGMLDKARLGLAALIKHYPEFPLSFLEESGKDSKELPRSTLNTLRMTLQYIRDREHVASIFAQAGVICIFSANRKPMVPSYCGISNFPAILDYPDSDESKWVASSVSNAVRIFLTDGISPDWRNYFWDQGRSISQCEVA